MIEKIKKALEGVELDFNIDDLQIMPKADFATLVDGYKSEIEDTKTKSQKIGQEILLKELKNDLGFDYEGRKDPENLKKAYVEKFGKTESANEDIEILRDTFAKEMAAKNSEIDSIKTGYQAESDNKMILDSLRNSFSQFGDKSNYKAEDLVTIAQSKGEFSVIDGKVYQSKDGEALKNELRQGITVDAFANTMMLDGGYIKKAEGGKIVGDETKGGKYTMEEFVAAQEAEGVNVNSLQFDENMGAAIASGTVEL